MLTYSCNRLRRYVKNVSLKDSVRVIYHDETDQNEEDLNPFYRIKPTNNATKKIEIQTKVLLKAIWMVENGNCYRFFIGLY